MEKQQQTTNILNSTVRYHKKCPRNIVQTQQSITSVDYLSWCNVWWYIGKSPHKIITFCFQINGLIRNRYNGTNWVLILQESVTALQKIYFHSEIWRYFYSFAGFWMKMFYSVDQDAKLRHFSWPKKSRFLDSFFR